MPDADETLRVLKRKGLEKHSVHDAEDRGFAANPDRESEHCNRAEQRGSQKLTNRVSEVVHKGIQNHPSPPEETRRTDPLPALACPYGSVSAPVSPEMSHAAAQTKKGPERRTPEPLPLLPRSA